MLGCIVAVLGYPPYGKPAAAPCLLLTADLFLEAPELSIIMAAGHREFFCDVLRTFELRNSRDSAAQRVTWTVKYG